MKQIWSRPAGRAVLFGVVVAVGAFGAGVLSRALESDRKKEPVPELVSLRPSDVRSIVVESAQNEVELTRRRDGTWVGAEGVPPETETLILSFEDRLFPLPAYRKLAADTSKPQYGLVDPEITFRVMGKDGKERRVLLGGPTFTKGVYARRGTDARTLYLMPRRMADDLRSLLAGQRVDSPNEIVERVKALDEQAKQEAEERKVSWWLQQTLDAGTPLPEGLE